MKHINEDLGVSDERQEIAMAIAVPILEKFLQGKLTAGECLKETGAQEYATSAERDSALVTAAIYITRETFSR